MPGVHPSSNDFSDTEPRAVAGYRLLRRIGSGGMSTVFLSYDVTAGYPVAVKLLADHLAHSREFVSRFYREARLSRFLSNPYLVQGFSAGYDPEAARHYLILEFVDGPTAHATLNRMGRFPVGMAVKVGLDIAQALAFMHARQYIHRDVKPDNILLHPDGTAKLADLGLAKRLNDDAHLTSVSQGVGTSYYMSYEQSVNANLVDGRSDIFALGATLYHLLAGEVPFQGASHEEIIRVKHVDSVRPLRELNPDVPPELTAIIARMLARDPRSRFQSVDELAEALEATKLATPIPPLPPADVLDIVDNPVTASDAPTRADLNAQEPATVSPTDMPVKPVVALQSPIPPTSSPPPQAAYTAHSNRHGRGSRLVLGMMAASAIGLGGLLAMRSYPHLSHTPTPLSTTHDSPSSGSKSGLNISVPQ
jgi:serine/threonine-protein kinase